RFLRRFRAGVVAAVAGTAWPAGGQAQGPAAPKAAERLPVADLATRFHFVERYGSEEKTKPELIGQYRVAVRETIRDSTERPQGAPERTEHTLQVIYSERPAKLANTGAVLAA